MSDASSGMQDFVPQDGALAEVFPIAVQALKTEDVETLSRLLQEHPLVC